MSHLPHSKNNLKKAYAIFFLATLFYLYEFVLQVAPAVMANDMMHTFHVTAKGFGVVSAFYFYAYAPMQLPAGLLFDRYGPRKLMTYALILCAIGSFFFASTDSLLTASLGRFLIGIGSAFSFIGVLVLLSRWFPASYFAVLAGVAQLMSSVGAIFGEMPLAILTNQVGWRMASFILSGVGFILALMIWICIRDYPDVKTQAVPYRTFYEEWLRLKDVFSRPVTWINGSYACTIWTPIAVFGALWGVPYLSQKYQTSVVVASGLCSMIWIGIGIGSPLFGYISDKLSSRKLALSGSALFGLISTVILLYVPNVSMNMMYFVLFFLGIGASGQTVSFAVVKDTIPSHLVGSASGFNNLSVLIGGAIFQPLVGIFLHHIDTATIVNNIPIYSTHSYEMALLVMPISFFLSFIIATFILKESHPNRITR